jgi:hypothetical protein
VNISHFSATSWQENDRQAGLQLPAGAATGKSDKNGHTGQARSPKLVAEKSLGRADETECNQAAEYSNRRQMEEDEEEE